MQISQSGRLSLYCNIHASRSGSGTLHDSGKYPPIDFLVCRIARLDRLLDDESSRIRHFDVEACSHDSVLVKISWIGRERYL
jgi:hypothetical protein